LKYRPKDLAAARFRAINEAYEVLADARRRVKYDAQLDALVTEPQAPAPPRPTRGPRTPETEPQPYPAAPEWKPSPQSETGAGAWPAFAREVRVLLITLGIVAAIQIALAILGIPETVSGRGGSGGV
jgi:hypothetical protein